MVKNNFIAILLVLLLSAMAIVGCQNPNPSTNTPPADNNPPPAEVRYTVTEEEWNAWTTYKNYTIEYTSESYNFVTKHTDNALEFDDGTIILFIDDRQYELEEKDGGYVAVDYTWIQYSNDGLLSGGYLYDEFTYDETIKAYVVEGVGETTERWEVRFENGIPVSVIYKEFNGDEEINASTSLYKNVGTTVISIPEYVFEEKEDVRTTVTEEEWNSWINCTNFTLEYVSDEDSFIYKSTENAIEMESGTIILFIDDKQYYLKETENGYVAYDCTDMEFTHNGLLSGGFVYDEFVYNELLGAYVFDGLDESGVWWEVKFENGVPVSIVWMEIIEVDGVEKTFITGKMYTDVGTTVIDIPDYVFAEEDEDNARYTVTEEEWNLGVNGGNFAGEIYAFTSSGIEAHTFKCTGEAFEIDGKIIIFEGDKKYVLKETDGIWYAVELENFNLISTLIPEGLDFNDYEYAGDDRQVYIPKANTGADVYYSFGFVEGSLSYVNMQKTLDANDPAYYLDFVSFSITEIGTAVIEVPEYVIAE